MTTGDEAKARELLANAKALLLDFDGPICSVFAGLPASVVAEQLRAVLADGGHTDLPESVASADDPFDVFRYAATLGDNEARYVEAAFTAHEVEAVPTAIPTDGAHDLIEAWHTSGCPLAIVSNNSISTIDIYLRLYNIYHAIDTISARASFDATTLKPNPNLLYQAAMSLDVSPEECVFIGDSVTDIGAAHAANIPIIGYANKPDKNAKFARLGIDAVTESLVHLTASRLEIQKPGTSRKFKQSLTEREK